jgi:aminomethyltransferase
MVANLSDHLFLVVNAACKTEDEAHLRQHLSDVCIIEPLPDRALIALQGPKAITVLAKFDAEVASMRFMDSAPRRLGGIDCFVSRSGYTGEDGFEISLEGADAERVARALLGESEVLPIGLGARDSLRLEAGLCLYGHDMDEATDPVEANLTWSMGKRRKEARDYPGSGRISEHLLNGAGKKRVGLRPEGRAPAREGTEIADKSGRVVGHVTSGGFGPSLNAPVAMGYVENQFSAPGTRLDLLVRGKAMPAEVVAMPFVPSRYKRPAKQQGK